MSSADKAAASETRRNLIGSALEGQSFSACVPRPLSLPFHQHQQLLPRYQAPSLLLLHCPRSIFELRLRVGHTICHPSATTLISLCQRLP